MDPIFLTPVFLAKTEVLDLHKELIDAYGGSHGIRDERLLESALAAPQATYDGRFLCEDIFEMAASYLHGLVQNHPFFDGNKRIGAQAANVFLELNDYELPAEIEEAFTALVLGVASARVKKSAIADFFREHATPMA